MAIAIAYRSTDSVAPAEALLVEVLPLTESFTVDQHHTVTNGLISLALEAQFYDWALTLASLIPLTDEAGNLREAMVGQIIYTALEQGQLEIALEGIDQLPPPARERDTWVQRAIELALDQGQGARADQIVQAEVAADTVLPWLQAQYAIARYEYQTGQPDTAKARLAGATQRIHSLPNLAQKGMELTTLVAIYSQIGEADLAAQSFAEVLQLAQATNGMPSAQPAFFVGSTQPLLAAGLYEWAYQLAQTVPTYELQTPEVIEVMQTIFDRQDFALAERLIPTTRSPEHRTQLWITLADYAIALDQPDVAQGLGADQRALDILAQAVAAARTIPDPEVRQTFVMGAGAYDYNDFSDRASQLDAIAQRYAYLNAMDAADQTINLIQSTDLRRQMSQRLPCYRRIEPNRLGFSGIISNQDKFPRNPSAAMDHVPIFPG
jgi:hypothetical protein